MPDSFAAARFDADDEVTMEWVYWPSLPKAAVDEAVAIQNKLENEQTRIAYLNNLPKSMRNLRSEVTIRHSDFADETFRTFGSFDVHVERDTKGFRGGTRNFGVDGHLIIHPNRRPLEAALTKDTPK